MKKISDNIVDQWEISKIAKAEITFYPRLRTKFLFHSNHYFCSKILKLYYKNSDSYERKILIGDGDKKLFPPSQFYWFLIGQQCYQKFSHNIIIVNPSAFQNGMTLENRVKIECAMSKNISLKLQMP